MSLEIDIDHAQGSFRLQAAFAAGSGLTALFGRSGSGKTTLVNAIAGLVRPRQGRIVVDGKVLLDTRAGICVPSHLRRIGYVFQDARLFPHLSVRQNLQFGRFFARGRTPVASFDATVAMLGIGPLLDRRPRDLSGGEKQRVAIGRALLACPRILLMDEPLAALDDARKAELLPCIERLRDETRLPIIYVSHALAEVARLATTVVVLEGGRVAATGAAADVLARPGIPALDLDGDGGAILEVAVARHDFAYGLTVLALPGGGELHVPRVDLPPGARSRVHIRARDVMLAVAAPEGLSALNILAGRVASIDGGGGASASVLVRVDCGGAHLAARITRKSLDLLALRAGSACHAIIKSVAFERTPPA